jgi:hypothetical protein
MAKGTNISGEMRFTISSVTDVELDERQMSDAANISTFIQKDKGGAIAMRQEVTENNIVDLTDLADRISTVGRKAGSQSQGIEEINCRCLTFNCDSVARYGPDEGYTIRLPFDLGCSPALICTNRLREWIARFSPELIAS